MRAELAQALRAWTPPIVWSGLSRLRQHEIYHGDYANWQAAAAQASGYDDAEILERVRMAARAVVSGQAPFERDATVLSHVPLPYPILAWMLRAAHTANAPMVVGDFGGSLGTLYRRTEHFLAPLRGLTWNVIEQPRFAECGRTEFQTERLRFHDDLEACLAAQPADVFIAANSLQYVPSPADVLATATRHRSRLLILDQVPVIRAPRSRVTIQHVPPTVFPATIPCWFFARQDLLEMVSSNYTLVDEFDAEPAGAYGSLPADNRSFVFERRTAGETADA